MFRGWPFIFVIAGMLASFSLGAQVATTNTNNACTCAGTATVNGTAGVSTFYTLYNTAGDAIGTIQNTTGTAVFNGLCPNAYSVTVFNANGENTYYFGITANNVNQTAAQAVSICSSSGTTPLSNYLPNLLPGGTWTGPQGAVPSGNFTVNTSPTGWYTYTSFWLGCSLTTGIYVSIIQNADPGLSTTYLICDTYQPFLMTDHLAGNPSYNGQWYDLNNNPISGIYDPATMTSSLFTYEVDEVPGCAPLYSTMFVLENATPNPGTNTSILVCPNAAPFSLIAQMQGNPDPGGTWFTGTNVQISDTFDPTTQPAGVYRYHTDGQTPCVDQDAYLTIAYTNSNPSGANSTATLCSNAAPFNMIDYLGGNPVPGGIWRNAQNQIVDGQFVPGVEPDGVYSYYYPNVGCTPTQTTLTVTIETSPNAGLDQSVPWCLSAGNYNLNNALSIGTTPNGSWTQGGNTISAIYTPVSSGIQNFIYTVEGNVCPDDFSSLSLQIQAPPNALTSGSSTLCSNGNSLDLNTFNPGISDINYAFGFTPLASSILDPAVASSGIYNAVLLSGNSCPNITATFNITIEQPDFESAFASLDVCNTDQVFDLNASHPTIDFTTGSWSDNNGAVSPTIDITNVGIYTYTYSTNTTVSCSSSEFEVVLNVLEPQHAGNDFSITLCENASVFSLNDLLSSEADLGGNWWYNTSNISDLFDPASMNSGMYTYTSPSSSVCPPDEALIDVTIQSLFPFNAGDDFQACSGLNSILLGNAANAGFDYMWSPAMNLSANNIAQPQISFTNNGTQPIDLEYIAWASDGICESTDTIIITVYPLPALNGAVNYEFCEGEIAQLEISGATNYAWSDASLVDDPSSPTPTFTGGVGVYTLQVIGENVYGCSNTADIEIAIYSLPVIVMNEAGQSYCPPYTVALAVESASENISNYQWEINSIQGTDSLFQLTLDDPGFYNVSLVATSFEGCTATWSMEDYIEIYPLPTADFIYEPLFPTTVDHVVTFESTSEDASLYEWFNGSEMVGTESIEIFDFVATNAANFDVCLAVLNEQGCSDTLCQIIHIENEYLLFSPNAFTPDGDGVNEVFRPTILGFDTSSYTFSIYDRWGILLFRTNDPNLGWYGQVQGGQGYYVQNDVYVWRVEVKASQLADYQTFEGFVHLIR